MDWTALGTFIRDVGIPAVLAVLLVWILMKLIKSNDDERKRTATTQDSIFKLYADQALQSQKQDDIIAKQAEQLKVQNAQLAALAQLVEISNRRQNEFGDEYRKRQSEFNDEYRKAWDNALALMRGASDRIDARIAEAERTTGAAISGVQTTVTAQHAEGAEQLQMAFDELNRKVETNGKATRDILEPIKGQLDEIREALTTLVKDRVVDAQAINALIGKVDGMSETLEHLTNDTAAYYAAHEATLAAAPADVQQTVAPDPLTQPQKHATGTLPALPSDAPDAKRDTEAT